MKALRTISCIILLGMTAPAVAESSAAFSRIERRVHEIREMKLGKLSSKERNDLKKELLGLKRELRQQKESPASLVAVVAVFTIIGALLLALHLHTIFKTQ